MYLFDLKIRTIIHLIMHVVIVYLIGEVKYKQLYLNTFESKKEAIDKYREYLINPDNNNEVVMSLLKMNSQNKFDILTAWALGTPKELKEAALLAIDKYENGEDLFIDTNLSLENLYGSQIYQELLEYSNPSIMQMS